MSEFVTALNYYQSAADQHNIGVDLHRLLADKDSGKNTVQHLRMRHLPGVVARHHGRRTTADRLKRRPTHVSERESGQQIYKAYKLHQAGELGVFVLSGYEGNTMGMFTVDPNPFLRQLSAPVPPRLADTPLKRLIDFTERKITDIGPDVTGWVAPGEGREGYDVLSAAYQLLTQPDGPAKKFYEKYVQIHSGVSIDTVGSWTVEPLGSPQWVHKAIASAGMRQQPERGYYDDAESRTLIPPVSALYLKS